VAERLIESSGEFLLYTCIEFFLIPVSRYMRDQPLSHPSVTDQHLLLWYFEDWLKKYFFSILQILEVRYW
jgi:hypothetical protein